MKANATTWAIPLADHHSVHGVIDAATPNLHLGLSLPGTAATAFQMQLQICWRMACPLAPPAELISGCTVGSSGAVTCNGTGFPINNTHRSISSMDFPMM